MNKTGQNFGGDWTEQKLTCVSDYLRAYTEILKDTEYNYTYIDAFAGMGYRIQEDEDDPEIRRFIAGSARRALEVKQAFPNYTFIEANKYSFAELRKLKNEYPYRNIRFINDDANKSIKGICLETNWKKNRALVFLDPYGMNVEWTTIELISHTQAIDLWLLFPIGMGVNRSLNNDGNITSSNRKNLNQIFGTTGWYDEFYQPKPQLNLFKADKEFVKKDNIMPIIEQYYLKRLEGIFPHVAQNPLHLKNSKNAIMYLLCFAAANRNAPSALKIAEHILDEESNTHQILPLFKE